MCNRMHSPNKKKEKKKEIYVEILGDAVRREHLEKWTRNSWFLLHENTPAYWSLTSTM
jgi:hypothetical protein